MYKEKREEDRVVISRQPKGKLEILAGERCIAVSSVKNMSLMGLRLETQASVGLGENVLIRYQAEGVDLTLNGIVVWCADSTGTTESSVDPSEYTVGIRLACPSVLQAFW